MKLFTQQQIDILRTVDRAEQKYRDPTVDNIRFELPYYLTHQSLAARLATLERRFMVHIDRRTGVYRLTERGQYNARGQNPNVPLDADGKLKEPTHDP